jgi:hypothetical protein
MTKLLEKAVTAVSNLPEKQQDAIAAMILEELADEDRWAKSFAASHRQLSILAKEALEEYYSGRTKPLDL